MLELLLVGNGNSSKGIYAWTGTIHCTGVEELTGGRLLLLLMLLLLCCSIKGCQQKQEDVICDKGLG